jgi:hypothetical protein
MSLRVETVGRVSPDALAMTLVLTASLSKQQKSALSDALDQWYDTSIARFGSPIHHMSEVAFMDDDDENTAEWWMDLGQVDERVAIASLCAVVDGLIETSSFPARRLLLGWREE